MGNKKLNVWLRLVGGSIFFFILYIVGMTLGSMQELLPDILVFVILSAVISVIYALFLMLGEKVELSEFFGKRMIVDTAKGFGYGAVFMSVVVGAIGLLGSYHIDGVSYCWGSLVDNLSMFLLVAVCEEIIFRGVIYKCVEERFGMIWALVVSGLLFGFVHISNAGATVFSSVAIAIEAGVMLGLAYSYGRSLWFPVGIHWAWNFFEGPIYGTEVSGNKVDSLLLSHISGEELISGGSFGPEASVVAIIFGTLLSYYFYTKIKE